MKLIFIPIATLAFVGCCVMAFTGIRHMNINFPNYKPDDFINDKEEENE